jgi:hypothetical protein
MFIPVDILLMHHTFDGAKAVHTLQRCGTPFALSLLAMQLIKKMHALTTSKLHFMLLIGAVYAVILACLLALLASRKTCVLLVSMSFSSVQPGLQTAVLCYVASIQVILCMTCLYTRA